MTKLKSKLQILTLLLIKTKYIIYFMKRGISYSEILDKELYILPILIKKDKIFIFNNNFFYDNWN